MSSSSSNAMDTSDNKDSQEGQNKMEDVEEASFSLSFELAAHSNPVRCVAVGSSNLVITAETDGLVHLWKRNSDDSADFEHNVIFDTPVHGHQKLMFSLENVKGSPETFVSGGNDNAARVWTASGENITSMEGHAGAVNSVCQTNKGHFVTGSFDRTAKVWKKGKCLQTLEGHQYGVEVCSLTSGEIVTGSHMHLHIWKHGKIQKTVQDAHTHVIRRILRHPLGFVTCANDGFVKVWSNIGDQLLSIDAHPVHGETASFVYSIAVLKDGRVVSVGEDQTAKIWAQDGTLVQVIEHPSSVRCVSALANGDFVTGSDITARIFTRHTSRKATKAAQEDFNNIVQASKVQPAQNEDMAMLDPTEYPGPEGLDIPGKDNGELRICNIPDKGPTVYEWDLHMQQWKEIGQAVGKPKMGDSVGRADKAKVWLEGKQYDHVTHVYIDENQKASLGFNSDDDPTEVAIRFCDRYSLDRGMHLPEIVQHLQPLADPIARAKKLAADAEDRRNAFKQVPSWKHGGFEINTASKPDMMRAKIEQLNEELLADQDPNAFKANSPQLQMFEELIAVISDTSSYHLDRFPPAIHQLIIQLLNWPTSKVLPVIDAVRVLMCHSGAVSVVGNDAKVRALLFQHAASADTTPHHFMLLCKLVGNWVAKRPRSEEERKAKDPPAEAVTYLIEALNHLAEAAHSRKKAVYSAYVMMAHNIMVWFGKYRIVSSDIYVLIAGGLFELLREPMTEKATFYSLLTIGTIAFVSDNASTMIEDTYGEQISECIQKYENSGNKALKEICFDLKKEFQ